MIPTHIAFQALRFVPMLATDGDRPLPVLGVPAVGDGTGVALAAAKVLIVDDDELYREELEHGLGFLGIDAISAADGQDALEVLRDTPGIDVVVTDLQMPRMDGLRLTEHIAEDNSARVSGMRAVIMLAASITPATQRAVRQAGARAVLLKTETLQDIADVIRDAREAMAFGRKPA